MGLDFFEAFFVHRFPQRGALLRAGMGRMMTSINGMPQA
jgi:hypothetical protein